MTPITSIVSLNINSNTTSHQLSEFLTSVFLREPGCQRVRFGITHEDAKQARCFVDWDDISCFGRLKTTPDCKEVQSNLGRFLDGAPLFHLVEFNPFPATVLDSKIHTSVVEVLNIYFAAGDSFTAAMKEAASTNAEKFLVETAPVAKGCTGETATGWINGEVDFKGDKATAFVMLIGWESLEAHQHFRSSPAFGKSISILRGSEGLKGVEVVHVSLKTTESQEIR